MSLKPGDLLDRYKLLAPVGEGGQGSVWKALDERGDRLVALKLHRLSRDEGAARKQSQESEETHRERLRREAQALRSLDHPSLVRCMGMFEDYEHDILGLVLEWIEGSTLTVAARSADMTEAHRMWVLGHLVRALAHMHQLGLVHRDLKFSNVLVSPLFWQYPSEAANIKLVDLGVAAPVGNPDPLTSAGGVVGTIAYLSPERIVPVNGAVSGATTASDVFAFVVLGWRLLSGQHPTGQPLGANILRFLTTYEMCLQSGDRWPLAGQVEGPWGEVLRQCLPLRPEARLESAVAVVDLLDGRRPSVAMRTPGAHTTAPLRQYEAAPAGASPANLPGASPAAATIAFAAAPSPTAPPAPVAADQLPTTAMPAFPPPALMAEPVQPAMPPRQPPAASGGRNAPHATFLQPVRPPSPGAWQAAPPASFVPPPMPAPPFGGPPPGFVPGPYPTDGVAMATASRPSSTGKVIAGVVGLLVLAAVIAGVAIWLR